jgi:hypothetical protein
MGSLSSLPQKKRGNEFESARNHDENASGLG